MSLTFFMAECSSIKAIIYHQKDLDFDHHTTTTTKNLGQVRSLSNIKAAFELMVQSYLYHLLHSSWLRPCNIADSNSLQQSYLGLNLERKEQTETVPQLYIHSYSLPSVFPQARPHNLQFHIHLLLCSMHSTSLSSTATTIDVICFTLILYQFQYQFLLSVSPISTPGPSQEIKVCT